MSPRADPDGIEFSDAALDYLTEFRLRFPRQRENHGLAAGNGRFQPTMTDDNIDSDAQTYDDAYLAAADYCRPGATAWTWLVESTTSSPTLDTEMTRRGAMVAGGALFASAMAAGNAAADTPLTINFDSEFAHEPTATGDVTVAEHRPEFDHFGYVADDDSERTLEAASLAEREDEDDPNNPVRIRGDKIDFADARAFPRDLTTTDGDGDEEDGSALDAEFWTSGDLTVEDDGDALRVTGNLGTATFNEFRIDSGEQRRVLQLIVNVDQLEAAAVVDVDVIDAAGNSVTATIDPAANDADDHTIATSQGAGVIYQQQIGDMDGGEELDAIEEIAVDISGGNADVVFHALNLESSSRWAFGTREYVNDEDDLDDRTVYEQRGYFGITSLDTLYDSDRLSDATISDVEYANAEIAPTDIFVMTEDGGRYDYDTRLHALYNFDLPEAYDLEIDLTEWTDEVAHPSGRYLAMEIATDLDDPVEMEDIDDVEWTTRTSSYSDGSIGDTVDLSSTVDSAGVFTLHEDVLLTSAEASEVAVEDAAAMGPTGRSGGGLLSRVFSIPGMIAGGITGLGIWSFFRRGS